MAKKVLVKCDDYNGSKDVLFMFDDKNDFRLKDPKSEYTILCEGSYTKGFLKTEMGNFQVFSDYSVKKVL